MIEGRLVGVMYACRACAAGNGYEASHCQACGASLRDAVPIRSASDFNNEAGQAFHRSLIRQHRQQSLGLVFAWFCPLQGLLSLLGAQPGLVILGHVLWAAATILLVARFGLGHLRSSALGAVGCIVLWLLAPGLMALIWLPIQVYLYTFAAQTVRATNDVSR